MTEAATAPRPIRRAAVDQYVKKYGADDIERWRAAGDIVIVESGEHYDRN